MRLNVKNLTGHSCYIDANPNQTVESLRESVAKCFGISFDETKLLFERQTIVCGTLQENGIHSSCDLQVVVERVTKITINIKLEDGKYIQQELEPSETIGNLKEMIQDKINIVVDQQVLRFGGKEITGGRLTHHHITDGSTLQLAAKSMEVFVRDFQGVTHTFVVKRTYTVDHFKQMVYEKTRVPVGQMRLQFAGKQLEGGLLSHYHLQNHSTIEMSGRLRGGF